LEAGVNGFEHRGDVIKFLFHGPCA